MATRVCPKCGSQYVASVRRCIDCDVMLVDEVSDDGEARSSSSTRLGAGDQLAYELEGWGNQLRVTLAGMLDLAEVPYVWEAGTLVVPAPLEAKVDECIAAVEGGEPIDLDDDGPLIAFDVHELSADELEALDAQLIADHVAHSWNEEGELLVADDSEDVVAAIIDAVLNPDDDGDDDGLATHQALDALFVVVDKLVKDPLDAKLVARYERAADGIEGRAVPYGLSGTDWEAVLAEVALVRTLINGGEPISADDDGDEAEAEAEEEAEDATAGDGDEVGEDDDAGEGDDAGDGDDAEVEAVDRAGRARVAVGALRDRLRELV